MMKESRDSAFAHLEESFLQVAHTPVDELRRPAAGPRRKVVRLHQRGAQAPSGGVKRGARARGAAWWADPIVPKSGT